MADDVTKGITSSEMNGRWLSDPEFLQLEEELWPKEKGTVDKEEVDKERRKVHITCPVTVLPPIIKCEDYSSWKILLRMTAYVRRMHRIPGEVHKGCLVIGDATLTPFELYTCVLEVANLLNQ